MKGEALSKKKIAKITLYCVLGAILFFIVIALGSLLVQKYIKKSAAPMFMGYSPLIVLTPSMSGTIEQGDLIIIKKRNPEYYKPGQIVTFLETGENGRLPITHRLFAYDGSFDKDNPDYTIPFITKGDANDSEDVRSLSREQILGEVVLTIPKVGLFFEWFSHGGGVIYVIAMIAIVVAGVYFWNWFKPEPEAEAESANDAPDAHAEPNEDISHEDNE